VRPARPEPTPIRPPGRILPATRPGEGGGWGGLATFGWSRLAAAILALIAVAALIWAISLQGRISDLEDENDDLQGTITVGSSTQTLAYILRPTADGPPTAAGVLVPHEDDRTARLDMIGLGVLPAGQVYQLWFVDLDEAGNPAGVTPSVTLGVDDQGRGVVDDVPLPESAFDAVAVTVEPDGGSQSPTTPIQMFGTTGTVAG
jgi:anti-sigma-K factor RskA